MTADEQARRDAACRRLGEDYARGRITLEELDSLVGRALCGAWDWSLHEYWVLETPEEHERLCTCIADPSYRAACDHCMDDCKLGR